MATPGQPVAAEKTSCSEHLRDAARALPMAPGVYIFWGAPDDKLPLYVGKSVHIRTRVLDHLRNAAEAPMVRRAQRIEFRQTAGEIGALLLESRLIKQLQPLFNKRLRYSRQLCCWHWHGGRLELAHSGQMDFARATDLFGLYRTAHAAKESMAAIADEHKLCLQMLGVEKGREGKPCFRHMIRRCAGACCGRETVQAHSQRTLAALETMRLQAWPYEGPIALKERGHGQTQFHVLDNWCYLGSSKDRKTAAKLVQPIKGYDVDSYKILVRPIIEEQLEIVLL
jgi:excinuclease Cho